MSQRKLAKILKESSEVPSQINFDSSVEYFVIRGIEEAKITEKCTLNNTKDTCLTKAIMFLALARLKLNEST